MVWFRDILTKCLPRGREWCLCHGFLACHVRDDLLIFINLQEFSECSLKVSFLFYVCIFCTYILHIAKLVSLSFNTLIIRNSLWDKKCSIFRNTISCSRYANPADSGWENRIPTIIYGDCRLQSRPCNRSIERFFPVHSLIACASTRQWKLLIRVMR